MVEEGADEEEWNRRGLYGSGAIVKTTAKTCLSHSEAGPDSLCSTVVVVVGEGGGGTKNTTEERLFK